MPTFQDVLNQYPQFQQLSPEEKNKLIQIYTNDPERFNRDISQIDFGYAMLPDERKNEIVNVLKNDTIKWLDAQIMQGKQIGEIGQPITEEEIQKGQEELTQAKEKEWLYQQQEMSDVDKFNVESTIGKPITEEQWQAYQRFVDVPKGMIKEAEVIPAEITATALKGYEYLGKGLQKIGFEETGKKIEQEARADVEVLKRNIDKFRAKFSNAEKVGAFITDMIPYAISGWATGAGETLIGNIMRSVIAGTGTYSVMKGYEFEDPEYQKEFKQFLALDVLFPITVTAGFMALNKAYQIAKAKDKLKIAKIFRKEAKTTPKENETELAKELKKVLEDFDKKSPEEKLQEAHRLSEEINKVQKNVEPEIKEKINEEFLKHAEEISNEIKKVEAIPEEIKVIEERIKPIEEAKPVEEVKSIEDTDIINKLNEYYKQEKERLKKSNMIEENKQKKLKGLAMEYSALKRHLEGNPTQKEIENTINKLNKIYKGKEVIVDGKKGIATGKKAYGKFEIEFEDGTKKFIPKNKIQHNTNYTKEDAINYLKREATEQTNMLYRAYVKGIKKQPEQIIEKATEQKLPQEKATSTKIKIIEKTPDYAIIENQNTGTRWKINKEQYDNLDPEVRKLIDEFDTDRAKTIEETKPEQTIKEPEQVQEIEQSLKEGKPVPEEVLKDYPDLAEKYKGQIELHAGMPIDYVNKAIHSTVDLIRKIDFIDKTFDFIEKTERKLLKPFSTVDKKTYDKLINIHYKTFRPLMNAVDKIPRMKTKQLAQLLEKLNDAEKEVMNHIIIKYFENPEFRNIYKKQYPLTADLLENLREYSEQLRRHLYNSGLLSPAQYDKWYGRYLFRPYKQEGIKGVISKDKIRMMEIQSGRKFGSILDELTEKRLKELGYIPNALMSIKYTLAHALQVSALDRYFRNLLEKAPEIIDPLARPTLVDLSLFPEIREKFKGLPKLMSPEYAWNTLIAKRKIGDKEYIGGWLVQQVERGNLSRDTLKKFIQYVKEKKDMLKKIKPTEGYINTGDVKKNRYGVLSGLPIEKSVAQHLGILNQTIIDPDPSKINKAFAILLSVFKANKVPLNIEAIPRNFISNFFQWSTTGGNPISYFKYYAKAIKHLATKDEFFQALEKRGVFNVNYASEEIQKILAELRNVKSKKWLNKYFDIIGKLATPYGLVDDLAKTARVEYELKHGKKMLDAIKTAQFVHYDYSLVPAWVEKARSARLQRGIWWKFFNTPFITYAAKTADMYYEMMKQNPAQTIFWMTLPLTIKYSLEAFFKKKYGKKYDKVKALTPQYFDTDTTIMWMDDKSNVMYMPFDYIHPSGQSLRYISEGALGLGKGLTEQFGLFESPLGDFYAAVTTGKDPFTGKDIYDDIDSDTMRLLKMAGYFAKQFLLPATALQIQQAMTTKHPVWTKAFGFNVYKYDLQQLMNMKKAELSQIQANYYRRRAHILGSNKSLEEKRQKMIELEDKTGERVRELLHKE